MMLNYTLSDLRDGLDKKSFSSVELTQYYLDRIKQHNPTLNAYISLCEESALTQAKKADARIASNEASDLTGIPIAHKDIFCIEGTQTTCGSKMLENFIAPYTASMVQQCEQAGMVTLGKTNMDEFAMGSTNESSYFGPCHNPWQQGKTPGGSSGGAASVVAARLAPVATGTDTGGSIRQPAAMCGITGLKPTYGLVSRYGMIAFASSLDQAGPMGVSAEDCALLLNAMAGHDAKDSTSIHHPKSNYMENLNTPVEGLTIGVISNCLDDDGLNSEIKSKLEAAIKHFESLGATIKPIELPHQHLSVACYYIIAPAEASSNLSRYDGVRYGYRCESPTSLDDLYKRSRSEGFGDEVKRRIMAGTYALSAGYFDAYYLKAQKIRQLIKQDYVAAFKEVDVLLSPTCPDIALDMARNHDDPNALYLADKYTISTNMAGLPGLALPMGFVEGMPVGFQLTGNYLEEAKLLRIGHQYQQSTDWHLATPENF